MLKIDLLPGHFAAARNAKLCLVGMVVLLLISTIGCMGWMMAAKKDRDATIASHDEWKKKADHVRDLGKQADDLEAEAAPIDGKVRFVEDADGSGEAYWAEWDKVNRYIFARAQVLDMQVQPPNSISFNVEVPDTTSVGRFILNIIRCPDISNVRVTGSVPGGPDVGPAGGGGGGGGGGMGMGMMGPGGGGMMGGMEGPGMMGGPGMMMGGPGGGGGGGGGGTATVGGPITLRVSAQLTESIDEPSPDAGGAAAAGGGAPGMGGMGGMGGGMPAGGGGAGPPQGGFSGGEAGGGEVGGEDA